jgi:tetratricopeptide (TPR) repeat protein
VGEPIRVGETIVVPFAKISFGLGGGGAMMGFGGGMGAKTSALGILIIEGDEVRAELFPEEPAPPSFLDKVLQALLEKKIVFVGNGVNAPSAQTLDDMLPVLKETMGGVTVFGNVLNVPNALGNSGGGAKQGGAGAKSGAGAPSAKGQAAALAQPQSPTAAAMQKLFADKKYTEALAMTDELIAKDPKNSDLHVWRGRIMGALTQSGNMADMMRYGPAAMQEFEEAVRLDPKNPNALFGRAVSRIMAPQGFGGDVDGAIADLEAALAIKPSPEAYFYLGEAYKMKGLNDKAAEAYKQALKLRPGYEDAAKALGAIK